MNLNEILRKGMNACLGHQDLAALIKVLAWRRLT